MGLEYYYTNECSVGEGAPLSRFLTIMEDSVPVTTSNSYGTVSINRGSHLENRLGVERVLDDNAVRNS